MSMLEKPKCVECGPGNIAEIAQSLHDMSSFRSAVLDLLRSATGSDSALWSDFPRAITNGAPAGGVPLVCHPKLAPTLQLYSRDPMRYDAADGMQRVKLLGGAATDTQVFTQAEHDSLPLFVDVLKPAGIQSYIICIVEFHGRPLSRIALSRHTTGSRFRDHDISVLKRVRSTIGIAEAAFGPPTTPHDKVRLQWDWPTVGIDNDARDDEHPDQGGELSRSVTLSFGISGTEHRVLELMERGLSNVEIAGLLGRSPHTVRNALVSAFRKLGVSRRAEAVYVLRSR